MPDRVIETRCCIAGGGPAGMMLGLLLARSGVDVVVLEKHGDFLRDFRGDTIHPSTLELMHELGLADGLLARPHQAAYGITGQVGDLALTVADFSHLPVKSPFVAFMPQWDFLDFLAGAARRYPAFRLEMEAEVTELVEEAGRIAGVVAGTPDGALRVRADLVVAADGRHSTVRARSGLAVEQLGAPIDVLWFRLPRTDADPDETTGRFRAGAILVMIDRADYWQCGYVIPKGGFDAVRAAGLDAFRVRLGRAAPFLEDRLAAIEGWDQLSLLSVQVDRLTRWWRPGLLCIGDAAHAMSPVGGVGINLAIQDAVAAANRLAGPLRQGRPPDRDLAAVQRRRTLPTRLTQRAQVLIQNRVLARILESDAPLRPPLPVRLLARWPFLRRIPGRLIGMGVRPEHVRTEPV